MKDLVIAQRNNDLKLLQFSDGFVAGEGFYRVITKCKAGFMVSSDIHAYTVIQAFRRYNAKAIQSIAFMLNGDYPITVYARNGKKVWVSECLLREMTVADINQDLSNTALYNQYQYKAVNAKTWADKAYVMNEEVVA